MLNNSLLVGMTLCKSHIATLSFWLSPRVGGLDKRSVNSRRILTRTSDADIVESVSRDKGRSLRRAPRTEGYPYTTRGAGQNRKPRNANVDAVLLSCALEESMRRD